MLSIIYPYRGRDLKRIKMSLQSLGGQLNKNFKVYFVDYGSSIAHANDVKELVAEFDFATYYYYFTQYQPWNKSKALNSIIKTLNLGYFFVADVDMIFHTSFTDKALELTKRNKIWYFKVGFLDEKESSENKNFEDYKIKFTSEKGATGLTLCPVEAAKAINGFDEFYHFWGSEDTDFHVRLVNAGYDINFFDKEILMLHQWHVIYRNKETNEITSDLQLSGIVQQNHYYLNKTIKNKTIKANTDNWGTVQTEIDFNAVNSNDYQLNIINTSKTEIDYFLFQTLPNLSGLHHFMFQHAENKRSFKSKTKSVLGISTKINYSLKEINDALLLHIINFYHNFPYKYIVSKDLSQIWFSIKKTNSK